MWTGLEHILFLTLNSVYMLSPKNGHFLNTDNFCCSSVLSAVWHHLILEHHWPKRNLKFQEVVLRNCRKSSMRCHFLKSIMIYNYIKKILDFSRKFTLNFSINEKLWIKKCYYFGTPINLSLGNHLLCHLLYDLIKISDFQRDPIFYYKFCC